MDDCLVRRGATVERCILDKGVRVGAAAHLGVSSDGTANQEQPDILGHGITLVGKGATIPARQIVGTNCLIDMLAGPGDFDRPCAESSAVRTDAQRRAACTSRADRCASARQL
jgi:glucose-1-phosphate adenylyltransferase